MVLLIRIYSGRSVSNPRRSRVRSGVYIVNRFRSHRFFPTIYVESAQGTCEGTGSTEGKKHDDLTGQDKKLPHGEGCKYYTP